jgi:hypothetical protein
MTPTEESALEEAKAILKLHFDSFLVTTRVSDEGTRDRVNSDWHGSLSDVIGLHHITGLRLNAIALDRSDLSQ